MHSPVKTKKPSQVKTNLSTVGETKSNLDLNLWGYGHVLRTDFLLESVLNMCSVL